MERKGLDLNRETNDVNNGNKIDDGFVDRSKVRILLCDADSNTSQEVVTLLLRCCYQVISVKSARQVIDALNAESENIDLILAEVGLPKKKGMKMLKYIARDKELHRIPVIMMSAQDEVSVVVKCLKLGAADYLVKPLRTNELLNLWTHMWRRRRMLGLAEKNMLNYDFDLVASEPSDANTNSTTLFSDDTDDRSKRSTLPETGMSSQQEHESTIANAADVEEPPDDHASESQPDAHGINDQRTEHFSSGPKKSELRIGVGESSAFFTYVKASMIKRNIEGIIHVDNNPAAHVQMEVMHQTFAQQGVNDLKICKNGETCESQSQDDFPSSNSIPDSLSIERSCTPPSSMEASHHNGYREENLNHNRPRHPRNGTSCSELEMSNMAAQHAYPYYMPGVVNHVMMHSSAQIHQNNDLQNHAATSMIAQYNHVPQGGAHTTAMMSYPYYPMSMCLQPGQIPTPNSWPTFGGSNPSEANLSKVDRREAALIKFRQKRKERCFDKKIRYVNRKQLAESRPRVRGQFVRKLNGANVDLNGQPPSIEFDEDGQEDEDEQAAKDSPRDA
ncbi:two-component response regulator-like APRR1 isoform X2 [Vicia villosa]|uniref:two-component response regulator-like APRR1 isoform X2 n=1 Tax=Vicia villosa TaxID=3911 RepID=UPI00273CDF22|nr:two-component response regulator-like APRR1 isoform X2 [Vicia villosa]